MVQSRPLQLPPQGEDAFPQLSVDGPRVAVGAARPGLHRFPAAGLVAGHQGVHPAPRHWYRRAVSALLSCCCTTDKTMTRSFDTAHRQSPAAMNDVSTHL